MDAQGHQAGEAIDATAKVPRRHCLRERMSCVVCNLSAARTTERERPLRCEDFKRVIHAALAAFAA